MPVWGVAFVAARQEGTGAESALPCSAIFWAAAAFLGLGAALEFEGLVLFRQRNRFNLPQAARYPLPALPRPCPARFVSRRVSCVPENPLRFVLAIKFLDGKLDKLRIIEAKASA
ncbi:MAG: hypothetical protein USCAAHI_00181 [Beijerinckiaceae bacterium]|nr:MAG: hypothetical protein USCAAHI_00181 [Beijerinckiaceae bacterium]